MSLGGAVIVLLATVMGLAILRIIYAYSSVRVISLEVSQGSRPVCLGSAQNISSELHGSAMKTLGKLRQYFCGEPESEESEQTRCEYCPLRWVLHQGKCYYFSEEKRDWHGSTRYCSSRMASLAVVDSEEEKTFIMNRMKMEKGYFWLGLSKVADKWLWVAGAGLPPEKFQVAGGSDNHNCVVCGADEVMSESCFNPNKWICEKATKEFPAVKVDLLD
ncbi:killer cell lectin-like receptor subfamily B member 1B allele A [Alligator sinensis]|uniref:Killer cell lectin-like receptor subfamily B member 1B allele A n=1 Tax=Alligator sinensis TaxID=38654 RepID=A0A3Q0H583_ALLSI|nr:killer cell lectin-like receptor subfamily B member 1B allele A [Alligator sinensis]